MPSRPPSRRSLHLRQQPRDDEPSEMTPCCVLSLGLATSRFSDDRRSPRDGCSPAAIMAQLTSAASAVGQIDVDGHFCTGKPNIADVRKRSTCRPEIFLQDGNSTGRNGSLMNILRKVLAIACITPLAAF